MEIPRRPRLANRRQRHGNGGKHSLDDIRLRVRRCPGRQRGELRSSGWGVHRFDRTQWKRERPTCWTASPGSTEGIPDTCISAARTSHGGRRTRLRPSRWSGRFRRRDCSDGMTVMSNLMTAPHARSVRQFVVHLRGRGRMRSRRILYMPERWLQASRCSVFRHYCSELSGRPGAYRPTRADAHGGLQGHPPRRAVRGRESCNRVRLAEHLVRLWQESG